MGISLQNSSGTHSRIPVVNLGTLVKRIFVLSHILVRLGQVRSDRLSDRDPNNRKRTI